MINREQQHSLEWYVNRLGKITGSEVWNLFVKPKGKSEEWSETAKSYMLKKAAERDMDPRITDERENLLEYLDHVTVSTKAMEWGTEQEENARDFYKAIKKVSVEEVGLCTHDNIEGFGSSPDGVIYGEDGKIEGCLEIKCPNQETYMKYRLNVKDAASLLKEKREYYWQCQSHMLVTDAKWCDFVAFCPWQKHIIHIVRIDRNDDDIASLVAKINEANKYIDSILEQ